MRKVLIILGVFISSVGYSQTNGTPTQIKNARKNDLKGIQNYTTFLKSTDSLPTGKFLASYDSDIMEYLYAEKNTPEGVRKVIKEAERILALNGSNLDTGYYRYLGRYCTYGLKDSITGEYPYAQVSNTCISSYHLCYEYRIRLNEKVEWTLVVQVDDTETFLLMFRIRGGYVTELNRTSKILFTFKK
jgi:hypothetical protein